MVGKRNINKIEVQGCQVYFDGDYVVDLRDHGLCTFSEDAARKVNTLLENKYTINEIVRYYTYKGEVDRVIVGYRLEKKR